MATRGLKNVRAYGAFIYLIGLLSDGEGAADLGSTTAVDDPVVAHQVSDDAERVVHVSLAHSVPCEFLGPPLTKPW